jgi:hypothetical protein
MPPGARETGIQRALEGFETRGEAAPIHSHDETDGGLLFFGRRFEHIADEVFHGGVEVTFGGGHFNDDLARVAPGDRELVTPQEVARITDHSLVQRRAGLEHTRSGAARIGIERAARYGANVAESAQDLFALQVGCRRQDAFDLRLGDLAEGGFCGAKESC